MFYIKRLKNAGVLLYKWHMCLRTVTPRAVLDATRRAHQPHMGRIEQKLWSTALSLASLAHTSPGGCAPPPGTLEHGQTLLRFPRPRVLTGSHEFCNWPMLWMSTKRHLLVWAPSMLPQSTRLDGGHVLAARGGYDFLGKGLSTRIPR